ncbi:hypothetical protein BDP27DRAFT_1322197 [Rhodocollybia butyracea]|uniref:Uncharacterized protein n=1 Tax=Rhodocollybia butyracea TaxID=206335 RepID=A0A9P5PZR2_9AGAR|nr:hypothetical protein BDP27DRAFT_1322197 [Rhodocollybia butyracea]
MYLYNDVVQNKQSKKKDKKPDNKSGHSDIARAYRFERVDNISEHYSFTAFKPWPFDIQVHSKSGISYNA